MRRPRLRGTSLQDQLRAVRRCLGPSVGTPSRPEPGASAVLLPLLAHRGRLALLFTRRSARLSHHAGEISLPGGRMERGDAGPWEAALRETEEELGTPAPSLMPLGHVVDFTTFRAERVHAFAAWLGETVPQLAPSGEVEEVLVVPLKDFLATDWMGEPRRGGGPVRRVTGYEARQRPDPSPEGRVVHYWRLDDESTIWGITGGILAAFLSRCFHWRPPTPARPVANLVDLLPEPRRGDR